MPKRMSMRKRNRNASTSESSDAHLFPSVLDRPSVNPHVTPDSSSDEMRPTRKIRKPQCVKVTKTVFINLDPTTVSSYHINKYFPNVEFSCPSDTVIHEELQGETSADILKDLLQDMEGKQFPLITFADFTAAISQSVPKDVDENIEQNVVAPMLELLNMICYKSDTTSEMTESYQALHLAVGKLIFEQSKAWTNPFLFDLEKFLGSILDRSRPHNNDNEAHYHMVQFWKQILLCFVCVDKELSMKFDLSTHGTGNNLPVEIVRRTAQPEDCTSEQPSIEMVTISTKPDLLFEAIKHRNDNPALPFYRQGRRSVFRTFVVEVRTTPKGLPGSCITSGGSGWQSSDSEGKSAFIGNDKSMSPGSATISAPSPGALYGNMCGLKTRHFLELVSMMRSGVVGSRVEQVHSIGLFVSMTWVYITGLLVKSDSQPPDYMEKFQFIHGIGTEFPEQEMHYHMFCSKPFNLLKPAHFSALIELIKYLTYHQYKEIQKF